MHNLGGRFWIDRIPSIECPPESQLFLPEPVLFRQLDTDAAARFIQTIIVYLSRLCDVIDLYQLDEKIVGWDIAKEPPEDIVQFAASVCSKVMSLGPNVLRISAMSNGAVVAKSVDFVIPALCLNIGEYEKFAVYLADNGWDRACYYESKRQALRSTVVQYDGEYVVVDIPYSPMEQRDYIAPDMSLVLSEDARNAKFAGELQDFATHTIRREIELREPGKVADAEELSRLAELRRTVLAELRALRLRMSRSGSRPGAE